MENRGGAQDFEPDHLAVLPVEHDVALYVVGRIDRDAIPARRQLLIRQIDIRRITSGSQVIRMVLSSTTPDKRAAQMCALMPR